MSREDVNRSTETADYGSGMTETTTAYFHIYDRDFC